MQEPNEQTGAPANGGISNNNENMKGRKRARPTPSELYAQIFSSNISDGELLNLRLTENKSEIPKAVVALIKRRMVGSQKRILRLKLEIADMRKIVRTRSSVVNDNKVYIDQTTVELFRMQKLRAEADLIQAEEELIVYRGQFKDAVGNETEVTRVAIAAVRELRSINRTAPSLAKKAVDVIRQSHSAKEIVTLAVSGTREQFRAAFVTAISESNEALHKQLTAKPKLLTRVIGLAVVLLRDSVVELTEGQ